MDTAVGIRDYGPGDAGPTLEVFIDAVTVTGASFYTAAQVEAWADPGNRELAAWHARRSAHGSFVATVDGEVVGFSDVDAAGHIDMLFVSPRLGRRGIATALLREVERRARASGVTMLATDASLVLRPLLERLGFTATAEQHPVMGGVALTNFAMVKELASEDAELDQPDDA